MKTIRCRHATDWVMEKTECELLNLPIRPNPLQHLDAKTTEFYYAEKGANDKEEAKKRIHNR